MFLDLQQRLDLACGLGVSPGEVLALSPALEQHVAGEVLVAALAELEDEGVVVGIRLDGDGANVRQNRASGSARQAWRLVAAQSRALSGNAELDAYVRGVAGENGYDLRSCFDWMLDDVRAVSEMDSDRYPGQIASRELTAKYGLMVMRTGTADCYGSAALFTLLARACGYQANFRIGFVPSGSGPETHGWTEVYIDGKTYVCDPSLGRAYRSRNWYLVTYESAPVEYIL